MPVVKLSLCFLILCSINQALCPFKLPTKHSRSIRFGKTGQREKSGKCSSKGKWVLVTWAQSTVFCSQLSAMVFWAYTHVCFLHDHGAHPVLPWLEVRHQKRLEVKVKQSKGWVRESLCQLWLYFVKCIIDFLSNKFAELNQIDECNYICLVIYFLFNKSSVATLQKTPTWDCVVFFAKSFLIINLKLHEVIMMLKVLSSLSLQPHVDLMAVQLKL